MFEDMEFKKKLDKLLNLIDEECKPIAESIIQELNFTIKLLDDLKSRIEEEGAIVLYKNGSQETFRQSPAFKGYYTLIPKFNALIKELIDLIPKSSQESSFNELRGFMDEYK